MKNLKTAIIVIAVVCFAAAGVQAFQSFANDQIARGYAASDWTFIQTWDLSDLDITRSADFYNGYHDHYYLEDKEHWTAIFIYDDGTTEVQELKWSWIQDFIQ